MPPHRVLIVVPPFHQVFIPAMGASLLKAVLERDGIPCDVWYMNIPFAEHVGPELYTEIASAGRFRALAGDWVFSKDLFGNEAPDPDGYVEQVLLDRFADAYERGFARRLEHLRGDASSFMDEVFEQIDWQQYGLVGISSTYQQSCAGLALLRRLRARYPEIATAMGGANCEGAMGAGIHDLFPFVDFVCSGEGDRAVPDLVRRLFAGQPIRGLPGILSRDEPNLMGDAVHTPMVSDLDALPYPDYTDYFAQFGASSLQGVDTPTLALETSRGCWWGEKHHCTFCGLNGGGLAYRSKSPTRALAEIDHLVSTYPSRRIYAIDNILDRKYFGTVLKELAERPRPPRLFYETKANLSRDELRLLARAGVWGIQPGVESLSTPILRLMDKGVTALQNLRLLKWCQEIGIEPEWNFLCGFPGEDPAEYQRLADLVPSLVHLQPPAGMGQIRLDRFSPYFEAPESFGLINVRASLAYRYVYPFPQRDLDRVAYYFDYEHADGRAPLEYAAPLRQAIATWQSVFARSALQVRDFGDQIEIRDSRPEATQPKWQLDGPQRLAYLALDAGATARAVHEELQRLIGDDQCPSREEIAAWLDSWTTARLVFNEGERYLSLAVNPAERVHLPVDRFLAELVSPAE